MRRRRGRGAPAPRSRRRPGLTGPALGAARAPGALPLSCGPRTRGVPVRHIATRLHTLQEPTTETRAIRSARGPLRRLVRIFAEHPIAAVVAVAFVARVILAVGSHAVTHGYVIPDERLYVELANFASRGVDPDTW